MSSRRFEIYSEDMSLIGTRTIELIGTFVNYPSVKNPSQIVKTKIEILHPCLRPASISAPNQSNPDEYYFTPGGANILVNPFIVDPPVCPVTYECISVTGPDVDVKCVDP